jgi:hypothetical protein
MLLYHRSKRKGDGERIYINTFTAAAAAAALVEQMPVLYWRRRQMPWLR